MFEGDNIKNAAILRDFLNFWTWQRQKRSYPARRPQIFKLTTSKNEAILQDFLQQWKVENKAHGLVPMRATIFLFHLFKVLRLARKSDATSYKVLHLSRKIISANLKILMLQNASLSGNQRPDLQTSLMNMSLVLRLPREMHLWRSSSNAPRLPSFSEMLHYKTLTLWSLLARCSRIPCACHTKPHLNLQKWSEHVLFLTFWLGNVLRATTACTFSTCQLPKVVRHWGVLYVLYILTWKYASRHNGLHFFNISIPESVQKLRYFVRFDFAMCFAPTHRALFWHLNSWKCSEDEVFCTFWLRIVLRATTACNFSSLIWPDGSAPAALASLLFDPPEPQIIGKTEWLATFLPFRAPASSFFWLFLFSDLLSSGSFSSLIFFLLPFSSLGSSLLFSSLLWLFPPLLFICPYCRKFDS